VCEGGGSGALLGGRHGREGESGTQQPPGHGGDERCQVALVAVPRGGKTGEEESRRVGWPVQEKESEPEKEMGPTQEGISNFKF
jgi:hypothetical protein